MGFQEPFRDNVYQDIKLNDIIQVDIPVSYIVAIVAAYSASDFSCGELSHFLFKAQEKIMAPLFVNEAMAAHQQRHDDAQNVWGTILGRHIDVPPHMESPE